MALLEHTLGILVHPDAEWREIRKEKNSFKQVFLSHVPLLALLPVVASYFGVTVVGFAIGDGDAVRLSVESALSLAVLSYFALLAGIFVLGEFINWMTKTYGVAGDKDLRHYEGTALAVYISTPVLLAGVANIYPMPWLVVPAILIAGAYSIYLTYEGIPILMNIDKDRGFMFASSVVTVGLVLIVTAIITTVIIWGMGMGPVYID